MDPVARLCLLLRECSPLLQFTLFLGLIKGMCVPRSRYESLASVTSGRNSVRVAQELDGRQRLLRALHMTLSHMDPEPEAAHL